MVRLEAWIVGKVGRLERTSLRETEVASLANFFASLSVALISAPN